MTDLALAVRENIRHDLDPRRVRAQIQSKIQELRAHQTRGVNRTRLNLKDYERSLASGNPSHLQEWSTKPDPEGVVRYYECAIQREAEEYARVRVIELLLDGEPRFILVYGDACDATVTQGTGPFKTLDEAQQWFFNGGR